MTKWRRERPRKVRSFGNPACSFSKPRIVRRAAASAAHAVSLEKRACSCVSSSSPSERMS